MSTSVSLSASGCFATASARAATTPSIPDLGSTTPSTSRPSWLNAAAISSTGAVTGVNSRIQDRGASIRIPTSILREEPHVVVEVGLDLVDPVADLRHPLETET